MFHGEDAKNTFLPCGLYDKDTAGEMENCNISTIKKEGDTKISQTENLEFVQRRKIITQGKGSVDLFTKVYSDIFNTDRYLINNVDINIKFIRNSDQFCLMATENRNFNIKINNAILYVRKAKISPSILLAHNMALEKATAKYPINRVIVNTYTISNNVQNFTSPNLTNSILPNRVVVGMVENEAFNGSYRKNPYNFQHFNLRNIALTLD
jgi:hypothetical protein